MSSFYQHVIGLGSILSSCSSLWVTFNVRGKYCIDIAYRCNCFQKKGNNIGFIRQSLKPLVADLVKHWLPEPGPGFHSRGDNILIFAKISVDCRIYLPQNVSFGGNVTGGDVQLQLYVCLLLKQTSEAGTKAEQKEKKNIIER